MQRIAAHIPLLMLIASLTGCATAAQHTAMVPSQIQLVNHYPNSVSIAVSGGEETNPLLMSQVSNEGFKQALTSSISESRLFSSIGPERQSDYRLEIRLGHVEQPMVGISMKVAMTTHWRLSRTSDSQTIWEDAIHSEYTAKATEHFVGVERLRKANEGAARENIREGLSRLSRVNLDQGVRHAGGLPTRPLERRQLGNSRSRE